MLTKIHHIGVAVRSADDALHFYRDALRLTVTKDAVLTEQGVRGVLLSVGETEIELLEPLRADSAVGRFLDSRGEGLHHLCFATDNIEAELADARAKSLPLIDDHARPGLAGMIAFLHPKATRGILVEYAQPADPAPSQLSPSGKSESDQAGEPAFDHLAVAFSDLDTGVQVFSANFGLLPSRDRESASLGIRAVQLRIGSAYIGAVAPLGVETPVADFIKRRGEGLYLISLAVADLDERTAALREAGQHVTAPVGSEQGARLAFISPRGTNGALIQLVERSAQ